MERVQHHAIVDGGGGGGEPFGTWCFWREVQTYSVDRVLVMPFSITSDQLTSGN